jgi:DNA replication and repair protein RecF
MLAIKTLHLQQFKNYTSAKINLHAQVNCFVGKNGAGKTNVLDAVYYLSFTKSYFNPSDLQHVLHGENYFSITATYNRNDLVENAFLFFEKGKKVLKINNNEVKKFSDHIGHYPLVMITPNDIMLLHEGSEERRKFLDGMIAQLNKMYLNDVLLYNRVLEQRNKQLRVFAEHGQIDQTLLETYNALLIKHGNAIHQYRKQFLVEFVPVFNNFYKQIANASEEVSINYQSDLLANDFEQLLVENTQRDFAAQRTTKGIHKDELEFCINDYPIKKFGSQGQQKSFIISLKLAQYHYLKNRTTVKPLLLLDDIFEKLDEQRLNTLLQMIANGEFGQILITDTHLDRLQLVFNTMPEVDVKYFMVDAGKISELE